MFISHTFKILRFFLCLFIGNFFLYSSFTFSLDQFYRFTCIIHLYHFIIMFYPSHVLFFKVLFSNFIENIFLYSFFVTDEDSNLSWNVWKYETLSLHFFWTLKPTKYIKNIQKIEHFYLPTHHFASPKLYLLLSPHLSRVTGSIYLFLSLCLVISIFSYPLIYPPTEV